MMPKENEYGFRYFKPSEFACTHTGRTEMDYGFIRKLDQLRHRCGFPLTVTSGFRDETHPAEAKKEKGGRHTQGIAVDFAATTSAERHVILQQAYAMGFGGIGVGKNFVHIDDRTSTPVTWTY